MGKFEAAIREEVGRQVRRELKQQLLPLEKEVRELRLAIRGQLRTAASKAETCAALDLSADADVVQKARIKAEQIRKLRRRLGVSQSQLATIMSVTPGAVAQWELSRITPRGKNREALVALRRISRRDVKAALQVIN